MTTVEQTVGNRACVHNSPGRVAQTLPALVHTTVILLLMVYCVASVVSVEVYTCLSGTQLGQHHRHMASGCLVLLQHPVHALAVLKATCCMPS